MVTGARAAGGRGRAGRAVAYVAAMVAAQALAGARPAQAQSFWDSTISNTHWYVTVPQMLAYATSGGSFSNPVAIGDQTLWTLGASENGAFTGSSSATLKIGPITTVSDSDIQGNVTPDGQITMVFTPTTGGSTTIGIGQMQDVGGVTTMEMQMITGTTLLVSHWAYMVPYDPATFTPPQAQAVPSNLSPQWAWTAGTPWRIVSPEAFGSDAPGTFIITDYKSGYFWGEGIRPDGTSFTLLGSVTPQGRVLFNTLTDGELASLYGGISGDAATAQMLLGSYDSSALFTGDLTYAFVVPPYALSVAETGTLSATGAAQALYAIAGTQTGLTGDMAPVTRLLNDLSGPALSAAISQTVPVLAGSASQATANIQRMLGQVVRDRLSDPSGGHFWLLPLGGAGSQTASGGIPGYVFSGGGLALGTETADAVAGVRAGAMFAFTSNAISAQTDVGSASMASGSANVDSYVLGVYGAFTLLPALELFLQANGGINDTATRRSLNLLAATAEADYVSKSAQISGGLRRTVRISDGFALLPAVRLDYLAVAADGYQESGAWPLNLSVQSQAYQELYVTGEVAARLRITEALELTARSSAGYNTLETAGRISAAFAGGGEAFVTNGLDASPWLFTAGAGLASVVTDRLNLSVQYDMQASPSGYLNQAGSLRLKVSL